MNGPPTENELQTMRQAAGIPDDDADVFFLCDTYLDAFAITVRNRITRRIGRVLLTADELRAAPQDISTFDICVAKMREAWKLTLDCLVEAQ